MVWNIFYFSILLGISSSQLTNGDSPRAAPEIKGHHSPKPRWGDAGGAWDKPFRFRFLEWGIPTWEMDRNALVGGLEHDFYVSIYWEFHHPNWRTHFSEGLKPPTSGDLAKAPWIFWCLQVSHVDDLLTGIFYDIPLAQELQIVEGNQHRDFADIASRCSSHSSMLSAATSGCFNAWMDDRQ